MTVILLLIPDKRQDVSKLSNTGPRVAPGKSLIPSSDGSAALYPNAYRWKAWRFYNFAYCAYSLHMFNA